jgi:uncharacterized membrane protein
MTEILAQFGAASAFAGVLATLLWRVIVQAREERTEMLKAMQENSRRHADALNNLSTVMTELKTTMQHSFFRDNNK